MKESDCEIFMTQEYIKGMNVMIDFLRRAGIICKTEDNCSECNKIDKFYNKRYEEVTKKEVINVTFSELNVVTKYLVSGQFTPSDSYIIIPPKEKIKKNELSSEIEQLITMGLTQVKQVGNFINNCPDMEFGEHLKQGFVVEYERLRNEERLRGDDLFNSLLDFASNGSNDFRNRAAGLSILVYLFEKCEVFEK